MKYVVNYNKSRREATYNTEQYYLLYQNYHY